MNISENKKSPSPNLMLEGLRIWMRLCQVFYVDRDYMPNMRELLRVMLGNHNVSTIPLQEFESNRFALASLYGKLANIYADLSDVALRKTGLFKMLTGEDTISAEFKFRDKFYLKNYAKLIFSCNKVPRTPDDTTAFFRRWIIINFPYQFTDDKPKTDKNLIKKLTTEEELSGFFNYALEGLQRLLRNGKFSYSKSTEETREAIGRARWNTIKPKMSYMYSNF